MLKGGELRKLEKTRWDDNLKKFVKRKYKIKTRWIREREIIDG
jgi:hypothetical protein